MTGFKAEFQCFVELFKAIASFLQNPKVLAVAFFLYLAGSMCYIVFFCRHDAKQHKPPGGH